MFKLRVANIDDHEFLIRIDLKNDGYTFEADEAQLTVEQIEEHSEKILKFLTEQDRGAYIFEDTELNKPIGMIMYLIPNRDNPHPWSIINELDRTWFQSDGRFLEIFGLWVHPNYRRLGLATRLKLKTEEAAKHHNVKLVYTHTEEKNIHVVELNQKLGYHVVRRGPIWDEIVRISLIKHLIE